MTDGITKTLMDFLIVSYRDNGDRNDIEQRVATDLLEGGEAAYLYDVLKNGCSGGTVTALIYYTDTHHFYDRFYDDIEELRYDWHDEIGEAATPPKGADLKNWFAWWAYEQVCYNINTEWEHYKEVNSFISES